MRILAPPQGIIHATEIPPVISRVDALEPSWPPVRDFTHPFAKNQKDEISFFDDFTAIYAGASGTYLWGNTGWKMTQVSGSNIQASSPGHPGHYRVGNAASGGYASIVSQYFALELSQATWIEMETLVTLETAPASGQDFTAFAGFSNAGDVNIFNTWYGLGFFLNLQYGGLFWICFTKNGTSYYPA